MNTTVNATPVQRHGYQSEIIAAIVGIGLLFGAKELVERAGMGAAAVAIAMMLLAPVIIYPIPRRWKVLLAILPHILASILILFSRIDNLADRAQGGLMIIVLGLIVALVMYGMERWFGRKGIVACIVVTILLTGLWLIS